MDCLIKGSKNAIAEKIVDNLPPADVFVDIFFGGGAITHRAMLTGKYKRFIVNDIDARLPKLFIDCAYGKYTVENHPEWVTREEFNRRKQDDAYIALVWSFGNNGKDYLYGTDIEDMKHALHNAVYKDELEPLERWGVKLSKSNEKDIYGRYLDYQRQIKKIHSNERGLENFERIQALEHLQSLQSLQSFGRDYREVEIPEGALIYADPPYYQTNCGKYSGFDNDTFYKWALEQDNIFISEYWMPDDFIEVARFEKTILSAANGNSQKAEEKIYTNRRTYDRLDKAFKERIRFNTATQMTMFDLGYNPYQE